LYGKKGSALFSAPPSRLGKIIIRPLPHAETTIHTQDRQDGPPLQSAIFRTRIQPIAVALRQLEKSEGRHIVTSRVADEDSLSTASAVQYLGE
jgi:hypothetical protein